MRDEKVLECLRGVLERYGYLNSDENFKMAVRWVIQNISVSDLFRFYYGTLFHFYKALSPNTASQIVTIVEDILNLNDYNY